MTASSVQLSLLNNNALQSTRSIEAIINEMTQIREQEIKEEIGNEWKESLKKEMRDARKEEIIYFKKWYTELANKDLQRQQYIQQIDKIFRDIMEQFDQFSEDNKTSTANAFKASLLRYKKDLIIEVCTTRGIDHPVRAAQALCDVIMQPNPKNLQKFVDTTHDTHMNPNAKSWAKFGLVSSPFIAFAIICIGELAVPPVLMLTLLLTLTIGVLLSIHHDSRPHFECLNLTKMYNRAVECLCPNFRTDTVRKTINHTENIHENLPKINKHCLYRNRKSNPGLTQHQEEKQTRHLRNNQRG